MDKSTVVSLLVLAATAAASPFSLVAFGLVLATDRGSRNGFWFILGWISTVLLIGIAVAALGDASSISESNTPGAWTLALEMSMGVIALASWRRRRGRSTGRPEVVEPTPVPGWQRRIATMRSPGAFVLGGAVQTWPVMIAAATEVLRSELSAAGALATMFVFGVATTAGLIVLEVLAVRSPGSAAARLDRMRAYIDGHRDSVLEWVLLLGGLWLFFRGLIGLITR